MKRKTVLVEVYFLGYNVTSSSESQPTFWRNTPPPSLLTLFTDFFMLVSFLACSSILKMVAICSSETLVDFHPTTRRYIPEDSTLFLATAVRTSNSSVHIPWYLFTSILECTYNYFFTSTYYFSTRQQIKTCSWME
jgi:hypothetical protein